MYRVFQLIHTLIVYVVVGLVWVLLGIPVCILLLVVPERKRHGSAWYYFLAHQCYYWGLKALFIPIKFVGLNNIPADQAVVFVANHQSALDIPLLGILARQHPHVWLAWSKLTHYPVLGFILKKVAVLVDTTTPQRAMRTLIQAINRVKENNHHVMIFPEGGRHADGKVHDFFSGFAILARRTNRPVVPVFIRDAYKVYAPDSWLVTWHKIKVIVGRPFVIEKEESDEAFKQRVYAWFVAQQEK